MTSELEMLKRRIVHVESYWDEEREIPWNYVARTSDGKFEVVTTGLFDLPEKEARELSLGVFDDVEAAIKALRSHLRQIDLADPLYDGEGKLNLGWKIH